jgi:uncharacterized OB-fold protein
VLDPFVHRLDNFSAEPYDMNTGDWQGPIPNPTEEMRMFWDGLERGEFLLLRCTQCGTWRWPVAGCRHHPNEPFLENMAWTPASGRGKVFAFTIQQAPHTPAFPVPYVYAAIQLEEGPMMVSNVVDCPPESVYVGMPVRVVFRRITDRYTVPLFGPDTADATTEGSRGG